MQFGERAHILKRDLKIKNNVFGSVNGVKRGEKLPFHWVNDPGVHAPESRIYLNTNSFLTPKEACILATEILREVKRIKTDA